MQVGQPSKGQFAATKTFSSLLFVNECLLDQERTTAMRKAIAKEVRPGDVVVDAGTGSGILALFAAEAGAAKVYALDIDQEVLAMTRRSVLASPFKEIIEILHADCHDFQIPLPADLVIMEMLDTGLIAEMQAPALNAMRRNKVIGTKTRVLPEGAKCTLQMVEYDFDFYGFNMPLVVQARNSGVQARVRKSLSETVVYRSVAFTKEIPTRVEAEVIVPVLADGILNALRLRTQTMLSSGMVLWETTDMNMPVIIPVRPLEVKPGKEVRIGISYVMGGGYDSLRTQVSLC